MVTVKEIKLSNGIEETKEMINNFINNMIIHFREEAKNEEIEKYIIEWREKILEFIEKYEDETIEENFITFLEYKFGNENKKKIIDDMTFDEITIKDFCKIYGMRDAREVLEEYIREIIEDGEIDKEFLDEIIPNLAYNVSMIENRDYKVNEAIEKIMSDENNYF